MADEPVKIDLADLMMAMESTDPVFGDIDSYLNLKTGEIITKSDELDFDYLEEQLDGEDFDEDPDNYRYIPCMESGEGYGDMEDFISLIRNDTIKNKLFKAINKKKPFRNFKDTLAAYPDQEILWFEFKENRMKERVKEWLEEEGIQYILIEREHKSVVEQIHEKEVQQQNALEEFLENVQRQSHVLGVLLTGSLVRDERMGGDVDILLFIDQDESTDMNSIAKIKRRVDSKYRIYLDVYVIGRKGEFLGNICFRNTCPTNSIDCRVAECGNIKYLRRFYDFQWDWRKISEDDVKYLYIKQGYDAHFFTRIFGDIR